MYNPELEIITAELTGPSFNAGLGARVRVLTAKADDELIDLQARIDAGDSAMPETAAAVNRVIARLRKSFPVEDQPIPAPNRPDDSQVVQMNDYRRPFGRREGPGRTL